MPRLAPHSAKAAVPARSLNANLPDEADTSNTLFAQSAPAPTQLGETQELRRRATTEHLESVASSMLESSSDDEQEDSKPCDDQQTPPMSKPATATPRAEAQTGTNPVMMPKPASATPHAEAQTGTNPVNQQTCTLGSDDQPKVPYKRSFSILGSLLLLCCYMQCSIVGSLLLLLISLLLLQRIFRPPASSESCDAPAGIPYVTLSGDRTVLVKTCFPEHGFTKLCFMLHQAASASSASNLAEALSADGVGVFLCDCSLCDCSPALLNELIEGLTQASTPLSKKELQLSVSELGLVRSVPYFIMARGAAAGAALVTAHQQQQRAQKQQKKFGGLLLVSPRLPVPAAGSRQLLRKAIRSIAPMLSDSGVPAALRLMLAPELSLLTDASDHQLRELTWGKLSSALTRLQCVESTVGQIKFPFVVFHHSGDDTEGITRLVDQSQTATCDQKVEAMADERIINEGTQELGERMTVWVNMQIAVSSMKNNWFRG